MVGSIAPLVQETVERGRRVLAGALVVGHVVATVAGAFVLGAVVWSLRSGVQAVLPPAERWLTGAGPIIVAVAGTYLLIAALTRKLPLPMIDRQVPLAWRRRWGPVRASFAYGFVLGLGVLTRINSPTFYLVPLAVLVSPGVLPAVAVVAAYGLTRGGIVAVRSVTLRRLQWTDPLEVARLGLTRRLSMVPLQLSVLTALIVAGVGAGVL